MTRDRLRELQERARARQEAPTQIVIDPQNLVNDDNAHTMDILNQTEEVRQSINRLEDRIKDLNHKQTAILGKTIVSSDQKYELERAIDEIKEHIKALRPRIREIDVNVRQYEKSEHATVAQLRIRKNRCEQLKMRLQEVLHLFNNSQVEYKRRVSRRVKKQLDMAGQTLSADDVHHMMESNSEEVFYREINPLSASAQTVLEDATNRHNEILRVERSIKELNDIFLEVYELVHMQDGLVNNIAKNVETAAEYTKEGNVMINRAVTYKKQAQRKTIICIMVAIGIVVALLLVILIFLLPKS
ncbi:unnamed protein product [Bursaphelenchus okinawaensis]|uniref:t-SNARE coiled-coil homology domain-containing protein n=1 Tax=Bursaphelenchus okinawaensis TaxID=465554 RepID=A0A811LS30_9BILA|nr:unnamed protein product [Bursaphelenchus okinawaensis]CAG9127124.1 unnamed protein product [Bursaphelenchus okinawaensis]